MKNILLFGLEEGKSEEEIASCIRFASQIAKELMAAYHIEKVTAQQLQGILCEQFGQ